MDLVGRRVQLAVSDPWDLLGDSAYADLTVVRVATAADVDRVLLLLDAPLEWSGKAYRHLVVRGRSRLRIVDDLARGAVVTVVAVGADEDAAAGEPPWGEDTWRGGLAATGSLSVVGS